MASARGTLGFRLRGWLRFGRARNRRLRRQRAAAAAASPERRIAAGHAGESHPGASSEPSSRPAHDATAPRDARSDDGRSDRSAGRAAGSSTGRSADRGPHRAAALRVALTVAALVALGAGVAGGGFCAYRFLTRSAHFAIREIRVSGTVHVSADALRARAALTLGENLFRVDLGAAARRVRADPWVAEVTAWRELPSTVVLIVKEREPVATLALGSLYLADGRGEVFKRASPDEAGALPVVTGLTRDGYIHDRDTSQALVREAFGVLAAWRRQPARAPIGEVHVDAAAGVTLFLRQAGVGIRVGHSDPSRAGQPDESLAGRLVRVDRVLAACAQSGDHVTPELLMADQLGHPDRITVKLARP